MSYAIKQSTTAYPLVFLMVDSSDHVTGKTGLTVTVTLSKAGAAFGAAAGAVSEISAGWYKVAGNATDTGTLGPLALHATSSGADPTDMIFEVVAYDSQDAVRQGLTALPNAAAEASGGLYTRGTGAGQINQDGNGRIDANVLTWISGAIPAVSGTGKPKVDVDLWLGTQPLALVSQQVQAIVSAYASGQAPLQPTTAGRTLDVATTGEAGLDFDNIKDATGAHTLTNITVPVVTTTGTASALTTNNDKTGYALSTAGTLAIWDKATSALTTAGSIGKLLVDNIDAAISSRSSHSAADVWAATTRTLSAAGVQAIWDALTSALTTSGSIGKLLVDNINATISSRLASASYTAPDNADILLIKAKTDNLPGSPAAVGSVMQVDLTQALDLTPVTETVGDALLAARAQGFGKWTLVSTTLTLYANDGTTPLRVFTLDSATTPTSRT